MGYNSKGKGERSRMPGTAENRGIGFISIGLSDRTSDRILFSLLARWVFSIRVGHQTHTWMWIFAIFWFLAWDTRYSVDKKSPRAIKSSVRRVLFSINGNVKWITASFRYVTAPPCPLEIHVNKAMPADNQCLAKQEEQKRSTCIRSINNS